MLAFRLLTLGAAFAATLAAQSVGPDVIVGAITDVGNYGTDGSGIYAYALGTNACNIGTAPIPWSTATNDHPVIAQHIYRLKPVAGQPYSRFEQIGLSWLKHGFAAANGNLCATCQGGGGGLGPGCSDPYGSGLNGSQGNGPRSDVNASNGYFPYPSTSFPAAPATIGRRIQCPAADVNPAQNAGALYWGEAHYVTPTDALAGNGLNNVSYRAMSFAAGSFSGTLSGATIQQQPALKAWQAQDALVQITNVDVPNDGRFMVAKRVTSLGGGNFHYEFVVYNMSSDRSARAFNVTWPAGTSVTQAGFRSIPYHSFEIWSNAAWTPTTNGASISWATETYQQSVTANALRWGTAYNFWCDATAAAESSMAIELFKPEPCPAGPVVSAPGNYILNAAAAFDNPTLTAPIAGPSGDDQTASVPIGFTFNFYGTNFTTVNVCTNGFLQFAGSSTTFTNTCLPSAGAPNNIVAGYWDDLNPTAGQITYQTLGVAPSRRFVVSWNNVQHFGSANLLTMKIILDETTNLITTSILASTAGGSGATRGVENSTGTAATQASCNGVGSALANTSQTYTWNTMIVPSALLAVTGSTGQNGVLTWTVNSNAPSVPVVLVASLDPGPTSLGALGVINLGLTPGLYAVIADGLGAFQPANPAHVTDFYCGDFTTSVPMGVAGLPPGLVIYTQGVVVGPASNPPPPNGQFHITTPVTINT